MTTKAYAAPSACASLAPFSIDRRDPLPTDVAIEILYCGVCHSDLHQARNEWRNTVYPCVPGHEIVGRVTSVGSAVTKFREGDLAAVGCMVESCRTCPQCRGTGTIERTDTHKVKIPAGIREGQSLRVAGQGEPGTGGAPAGDLYLRVRFAKHPDFRVVGSDLHYDLDLAPWEAALGTNVSVPTLDGSVNIKIPPGTQNGQRLRVRGRGLAATRGSEAGDLYVIARVQMPKELSEREKELWEQLARVSHFNPRG